MNTISISSSSKLLVKKSQFYGFAIPISSLAEVKDHIAEVKKKYKSAGHVAYAFSLSSIKGDNVSFTSRFDDAGEPSKTAGFPLLQIIEQKELCDVLLIVARVFGGIKLGTAGLISSYGDAGRAALEENTIIKKEFTKTITVQTSLDKYTKLELEVKKMGLEFAPKFAEVVYVDIKVPLKSDFENVIINFVDKIL